MNNQEIENKPINKQKTENVIMNKQKIENAPMNTEKKTLASSPTGDSDMQQQYSATPQRIISAPK